MNYQQMVELRKAHIKSINENRARRKEEQIAKDKARKEAILASRAVRQQISSVNLQIERMHLLIKFPTRQRPDKFKKTLHLYLNHLSGRHDVEFVITMDSDDETMNNDRIKRDLNSIPNLTYFYGKNKNKIEAVNANLENKTFDVLLLASDDQIPIVHGYDNVILANMHKYYPNLDGVLHFNDGTQGEGLNTLSIMGYNFYKIFNYIYHPDYVSLFCDNEFMLLSQAMGKATYIPQIIIKHDWVKYTGKDSLHVRNEQYYQKDKKIFEQRKSFGFPFESILDRV